MKKFMTLFLIGQMLVVSIIYARSLYDIFLLRNMGASGMYEYYLDEAEGSNLGKLYDALKAEDAKVEIIKEPVTDDGIMEFDVMDTGNISLSRKVPITKEKRIVYSELEKEDFIDSTGKFSTNLREEQIRKISSVLNLNVHVYTERDTQYFSVLKDNIINIVILLILSQFMFFVFTFSRIRINAIKKLNGFSAAKMILDSSSEFVKMEAISFAMVILLHTGYCLITDRGSVWYFTGLIITLFAACGVSFVQLLITEFSIKLINVSDMIKNKMYSDFWCMAMNIAKIIFVVVVAVSISMLLKDYNGYECVLHKINSYRGLNRYYTSNGYNSDSYDRIFGNSDMIEHISRCARKMYTDNYRSSILVNANITSLADEQYMKIHNTDFRELCNSYRDNYVVVNRNWYDRKMRILDENGKYVQYRTDHPTVLVPVKYKDDNEVKQFCRDMITTFCNYDNLNENKAEKKVDDISIIYIENDQSINVPDSYLLEGLESVTNSIIFMDNERFAGTWYLEQMSAGKLTFELPDRDQYQILLNRYGLSDLLSAETMLTPLSEKIRFYEFVIFQSSVFVVLFGLTLLMIIYFSDYLEIVVNRKKYAVKYLRGYSMLRNLEGLLLTELILVAFSVPLMMTGINTIAIYAGVFLDILFTVSLYEHIVVHDVTDIMRGE